ncbi:unnamed protein product, partial [Tuber aestivum]
FAENAGAAIWAAALTNLNKLPPDVFLEFVEPKTNRCAHASLDFQMSGVFPGLFLHQPSLRHPSATKLHPDRLFAAARWWVGGLVTPASGAGSRGPGFAVQPSFQ